MAIGFATRGTRKFGYLLDAFEGGRRPMGGPHVWDRSPCDAAVEERVYSVRP
jgi:hypothetical protein